MPDWNSLYDSPSYVYGKEPNAFLVDMVCELHPRGRVLMIGDGEGRNGVYMASLGYDVVSLDMASNATEKTLALAKEQGVTLSAVTADLLTYDFGENTWDMIIVIFCHLDKNGRKSLYDKSIRALTHDGFYLTEVYSPAQLSYGTGGPKELSWLVDEAELQDAFRSCNNLFSVTIERAVVEGEMHTGLASVVQFLAQKM